MQAFEFFNDFGIMEYQEDCKRIWNYLEDAGKINISKKSIAKYYREYCNKVWDAGWMDLDNNILYGFAEWLSEQEI